MTDFRIGFGYDFHRLIKGDYLLLGGVKIKSKFSIDAHSDGDIILHALSDAIYGSLAKDDIGTHFPSTDNNHGIASQEIIKHAYNLLKEDSYIINNIDITLVLETPKLQEYIREIRSNISFLLNIEADRVSIKSSTSQKIGIIGESKAIACYATILINHE